jgi:ribonuclease VapC
MPCNAGRLAGWQAGRLRGLTVEAGLSLGDRFCLALAKREKLPAWTADKTWCEIADVVKVKVVMIR